MELQQQDKKSFGSFHSDNVELLIRQPPDAYVEPQLPVPLGELLPDGFPSFGHGMRDTHFLLDPEWTFINHGAFGVCGNGLPHRAQAHPTASQGPPCAWQWKAAISGGCTVLGSRSVSLTANSSRWCARARSAVLVELRDKGRGGGGSLNPRGLACLLAPARRSCGP